MLSLKYCIVIDMVIKFKRSIVESAGSLRVNIPKEVAEFLNLNKGDTVYIYLDDKRMILEKIID